ncbi:MAG: IreB family regulatory phosphoprotein [Tenericutes bacterium]|nr:IreB family regulatory phosphoprotein [Mycoplasmatota bacterium]
MSQDKTSLFELKNIDTQLTRDILNEVYVALKERGYNPNNQIIGYLISGDPGYISSYKDARSKIQEIDRAKIVEILLEEFQKGN